MTWQKDIFERAQIYQLADSANKGSQNPETQNQTNIRKQLINSYLGADQLGILNEEGLTEILPTEFYDSLLQSNPSEVAHHAGNLIGTVEPVLIESVIDNYNSAINSLPTEGKEGLEGILLETNPQGVDLRTGEVTTNDEYSDISEQHLKYLASKGAASQGNVAMALNSFKPLTREALASTNARMPHLLKPLAEKYAEKQGEKYLDMFTINDNRYDSSKMKDYITRNIDVAEDSEKGQYYKEIGLRVPAPEN